MSVDISLNAFNSYIKSTQSEATARKYRKGAEMLLLFLHKNKISVRGRSVDLTLIPRNALQLFTADMIQQEYAPSSITLYNVGIQRYLRWCRDQGLNLPYLAKPDLPRARLRVRGTLKREDLVSLFNACNELLSEPARTAIMLMPCCGLRSNEMSELELTSIQKVDFRLQNGTMKKGLALKVIGKYKKERYVPLLDEGNEILAQYLKGWRRSKGGPWLFPGRGPNQSPVTSHTLWLAVAKVRNAIGIKMSPHTLRRTYATLLWKRGVADTTIAKILGHENLQTLYKHYLNMTAEDLSSAVQDKGGKLLSER